LYVSIFALSRMAIIFGEEYTAREPFYTESTLNSTEIMLSYLVIGFSKFYLPLIGEKIETDNFEIEFNGTNTTIENNIAFQRVRYMSNKRYNGKVNTSEDIIHREGFDMKISFTVEFNGHLLHITIPAVYIFGKGDTILSIPGIQGSVTPMNIEIASDFAWRTSGNDNAAILAFPDFLSNKVLTQIISTGSKQTYKYIKVIPAYNYQELAKLYAEIISYTVSNINQTGENVPPITMGHASSFSTGLISELTKISIIKPNDINRANLLLRDGVVTRKSEAYYLYHYARALLGTNNIPDSVKSELERLNNEIPAGRETDVLDKYYLLPEEHSVNRTLSYLEKMYSKNMRYRALATILRQLCYRESIRILRNSDNPFDGMIGNAQYMYGEKSIMCHPANVFSTEYLSWKGEYRSDKALVKTQMIKNTGHEVAVVLPPADRIKI
jgi:hypothetical protein